MSTNSKIEWTEATWNPVTGCTKVSPACAHCYIERTPPFRTRGRTFVNGHIPVILHPDRLDQPLRRRKPTVYFVNSLSDLFHADIPDAFIDRVFAVMALAPQHTFQILTKRAERMRAYVTAGAYARIAGVIQNAYPALYTKRPTVFPWRNVWFGVSVENQSMYDKRIGQLLRTPASVRFLSVEPMLGPIDMRMGGMAMPDYSAHDPLPKVDWIIVGGESGPRVRPTEADWIRSMRDQCVSAGVPFFFKQWGGRTPKSGGRLLDGREWNEMPRSVDVVATPVE